MGRIRDAILGATTLPEELVELPEIETAVRVRGLTGFERDAFEASLFVQRGKHREQNLANLRAKLVVRCVLDEDGQPAFSEDDAKALGQVRADVLDRLFSTAQRLSGLREEDVKELGKPSA